MALPQAQQHIGTLLLEQLARCSRIGQCVLDGIGSKLGGKLKNHPADPAEDAGVYAERRRNFPVHPGQGGRTMAVSGSDQSACSE